MKISNDFDDDDDYLAGFYESKMSYYENNQSYREY